MLVDQLERQNESHTTAFSHQSATNALHGATPDADLLAHDQRPVRLDSLIAQTGAQKFNVGIEKGNMLSAVANNMKHSGRLEHPGPFSQVDMNEEVAWEERQDHLHSLPVLPNPDGLISGEKRVNPPQIEVLRGRLFVLGNGEDRIPSAAAQRIPHRRADHRRVRVCNLFKRFADQLLVHPGPLVPPEGALAIEANSLCMRAEVEGSISWLHQEMHMPPAT